jgi:hypothetical protein
MSSWIKVFSFKNYMRKKNSLSEILYVMLSRTSRTSGFATAVMAVENRVSGSHFSDQQIGGGVLKLENGKCIPSGCDNAKQ